MLAQQKGSRLRATTREDGVMIGKSVYFDRIGPTAAVRNTARHADTPLVTTQHSRRRADLVDYDWADLVDQTDKLRTLFDPQNSYAVNAMWAMGRAMDDEIIAAMAADAIEGQAGGTTTALPAAQKIANGSTDLTVAKLLTAREILEEAEVDPDARKYILCSADQITALLGDTNVTSADFNTVRALAAGEINSYMGFDFIRSERIAGKGTTDALCYAYTADAMGLMVNKDMMVDIGPRRDKRNAMQVYVCMSLSAVRIEDKQLVQIACDETA